MYKMCRRSFTLIELLVVVAIIAVLVALLLPALQQVRERAKITLCAAQLRGIAVGINAYASDNSGLFPAPRGYLSRPWAPGLSPEKDDRWRYLPYLSDAKVFFCPASYHQYTDIWIDRFYDKDTAQALIDYPIFVGQGIFALDTIAGTNSAWFRPDQQGAIVSVAQASFPSRQVLCADTALGKQISGGGPPPFPSHGNHALGTRNRAHFAENPTGANRGYIDTHVTWGEVSELVPGVQADSGDLYEPSGWYWFW